MVTPTRIVTPLATRTIGSNAMGAATAWTKPGSAREEDKLSPPENGFDDRSRNASFGTFIAESARAKHASNDGSRNVESCSFTSTTAPCSLAATLYWSAWDDAVPTGVIASTHAFISRAVASGTWTLVSASIAFGLGAHKQAPLACHHKQWASSQKGPHSRQVWPTEIASSCPSPSYAGYATLSPNASVLSTIRTPLPRTGRKTHWRRPHRSSSRMSSTKRSPTGANFWPVTAKYKSGASGEIRWQQAVIENVLPPMAASTSLDETSRCGTCKRGRSSENTSTPTRRFTYRREDLTNVCDFNLSWEWFGPFGDPNADPPRRRSAFCAAIPVGFRYAEGHESAPRQNEKRTELPRLRLLPDLDRRRYPRQAVPDDVMVVAKGSGFGSRIESLLDKMLPDTYPPPFS